MAEKIKTEFKGGKKIVTFPDGKVKEIKKDPKKMELMLERK